MENSQDKKLGTESIGKLIFSLALPAILAQLINVLYNIVDRIYIGHIPEIGDLALTGVGVTFPIIMLISAFSALAGMGGAPLASIKLGAGDKDEAEKILGNSTTLLLIFSVILTIVFMIFKEPLLYMFGASDNTIVYGLDYITIYLFGTIFVQFALGLNMYISAQGFAKTAMLSVLIGAITNIVLDPIFIFGFNMGVNGAALATIISQCLSAIWVLYFLISTKSKSIIKIKRKHLHINKKIALSIIALGVSPFIMQATESLINIVLNSGLQRYGNDLYVGSMTIMMSVMQLLVVPIQGLTQGVQPIISYNYGAKNFDRVKKTFKLLIIISFTATTLGCLTIIIFPEIFVGMFTQKEELAVLTSQMIKIYMAGMWAFGLQMACQSTFMGLGQAKISLFLALLRKVVLLIPLALLLPIKFGVNGIYYSEPIADIVASFTTLTVFLLSYKKILSESSINNSNIA
ncbi:MAG: MATE family efflux transporter [Clostridium sp.]|nr:MATE family efflux transporter [Clostridium sp.]